MIQLFKSKPGLADGDKARIEFHIQQIAESVGSERMRLPVLSWQEILYTATDSSTLRSIDELKIFIGKHLSHDVGNVSIHSVPQALEKCGGGG